MTTVQFKEAFFRDNQIPQTLEDGIRRTAAYSGIHDFDFQDLVTEDFSGDLSDWTESGGTPSIVAGQLSFVGATADPPDTIHYTTEVPLSFVASFDWISGYGGFIFKGISTGDTPVSWYQVNWTNSALQIKRYVSGSGTILSSLPKTPTIGGRIQIQCRLSLDSSDEDRKWVEIGMFLDGNCVLSFSEDIGETANDWTGNRIGFCVVSGDTLVVDNLTVSSLHRGVEWVLIDPGQPVGTGLSRAIGTTRVNYMCRYDNTLRVWRPGNRDEDYAVPDGRIVRLDHRRDPASPTHSRVQAAIHEADYFDEDEGDVRMHRFILYDDPNIMSEEEAYAEAQRVVHEYKERSVQARIVMPPLYLLEPHDRISADGDDWRVVTTSLSIQNTSEGPRIAQQIDAQQYIAQ